MQHKKVSQPTSWLPWLICALSLVTLGISLSTAQAQNNTPITEVQLNVDAPDKRLENYNKALQLLRSSLEIFPRDSSEATNNIISAEIFFSELQAGGIGENSLVDGVGVTFERAKLAITQRLPDDLAIQATVIEGGLQRLLYEAATANFSNGEFAIGKNRIVQIAKDVGANPEQLATLENAPNSSILLNNFELLIANNINTFTTEAQNAEAGIALGENNLSDAYLPLAQAYGNYVVIQDSSNIPLETKGAFAQAIHSLLDTEQGEGLDFNQEVQGLNTYINQFRARANQALGASDSSIATPVSIEPVALDTNSSSTTANNGLASTPPTNTVAITPVNVAGPNAAVEATINAPTIPNVSIPTAVQDTASNATNTAINFGTAATEATENAIENVNVTTSTIGSNIAEASNTLASNTLASNPVSVNVPNPTLASDAQQSGTIRQPIIAMNTNTSDSDTSSTITPTVFAPPVNSQIATPNNPAIQLTAEQSQELLAAQLRDSARRDLTDFSLTASIADNLVNNFAKSNIANLDDVFQRLYSYTARSTTQIELGDYTKAREEIRHAEDTYKRYLQPVITEIASKQDAATIGLFNTFGNAPSLRLQDVAILAGQIEYLETTVQSVREDNAPPTYGLHTLITKISQFWVGPLRVITMFLIALLAIIPLVLLNRAFGVNNPNWRWVGLALFLLLLPAIYEGFAFALGWLAQLLNQPSLNVLSRFSIFQNNLTQIIWAFLTLLAIIFASIGLYGICVQFGVLGGGRRKATVITQDDTRMNVTNSDMGADTVVDWDEDF